MCCVFIFQNAARKVLQEWRTGLDASVNPIRDIDGEIDMAQNLGPGTFQPGGPTCTYNGKHVSCLCYANDIGGITGEMLVEILTYFDSINLFP